MKESEKNWGGMKGMRRGCSRDSRVWGKVVRRGERWERVRGSPYLRNETKLIQNE
jgi:hypothetical protein